MHSYSYKAFLSCLLFSLCSADQGFRFDRFANRLVGKFSENIKALSGQPSTTLEPEHEAVVQEVAQVMNIKNFKVRSHHGSVAFAGPHANGDVIYLTDEWFEQGKRTPFAQKFVIGHELAHVEEAHSFLRILSLYGLSFGSIYLAKKLSDYTTFSEKADRFFAQRFPQISSRSTWGNLGVVVAGITVGLVAKSKLSRVQEFEADMKALEKMGPIYGYDNIRQGAADFLVNNLGFEPWIHGIFSSHPHSGDRLRALGLKQEVSQEAGARIQPLLEERIDLRIQFIECPEDDDEQQVLLGHRMAKNWKKILHAVRICSVHHEVAKNYCSQLNSVSYVELFSKKFEERFAYDSPEAKKRHLYENAVTSECWTVILCLQELA